MHGVEAHPGDVIAAALNLAVATAPPHVQSAQAAPAFSQSFPGAETMTSRTITTKDGAQIFYKDWGTGQPIIFHHGWR